MNLLDTIDEVVLGHVNKIDDMMKSAQENINSIKSELGKAGFEVEFETFGKSTTCYVYRKMSNEDKDKYNITVPAEGGGFVEERGLIGGNEYVAKETASLHEDDYYVEGSSGPDTIVYEYKVDLKKGKEFSIEKFV